MKLTAAALLLSLPAALSWGQTGHRLTGAIAQRFLSPQTAFNIRKLLPEWNGSLTRAATWADEIKGGKLKTQYEWASELHYVSANSNPPKECGFNYERDCVGGKCVVGAIGNFTRQLGCEYPKAVRAEALKFVVHFIGDIMQPMHTCKRQLGGNEAIVTFDKNPKRNLHSVWDTQMVEKRILKEFGNSTSAYLDYMVYQVRTTFKHQHDKWTLCLNKDRTAPGDGLECAIQWAQDTEPLNCEVVWKYFEDHPKEDFGKEYFERNWRTVEQQIIKAGVRMAKWLDLHVKTCPNEHESL
jgi:hypothetical protein